MIPINDILVHINYRCVEKGKDVGQRSNMGKKYMTKETFLLHPKNLTNQMSQLYKLFSFLKTVALEVNSLPLKQLGSHTYNTGIRGKNP